MPSSASAVSKAKVCFAACLVVSAAAVAADSRRDPLADGFRSPPDAARPWVWWHWMDGQVSKEGIDRDLGWMKRIGIGGADVIDVAMGTPSIVQKPLTYLSADWKDAFHHAAEVGSQLGLELLINSSAGWSETGGPWIEPHQAMKKLVWSRTLVQGGKGQHSKIKLAPLPTTTGPFQDIPAPRLGMTAAPLPTFNKDTVVMAYRLPPAPEADRPEVTCSGGPLDPELLSDGDLNTAVSLPAGADGRAWVQLAYARPQAMRSAVLGTSMLSPIGGGLIGELEAQKDGGAWQKIATLSITNAPQVTVSFEPVTAKLFRVLISRPDELSSQTAPAPGADLSNSMRSLAKMLVPKSFAISELSLSQQGRINEAERKAGFSVADDYYALGTPDVPATDAVPTTEVVDLTGKMAPDGTLGWKPPAGRWVVLRMGYSLTGKTNGPSSKEATGLEVDKLNKAYVKQYMDTYVSEFDDFLSPSLIGAHGVRGILADSTETGPQNWTDDMLGEFQRLRGYDPRPWLPALTGVIIQSAAASDKFLWDFRRTIADLLATSHYAEMAAASHAHGLVQYGEALEDGRPQLGDDMEMRRYTDVPTGAMWASYPYQPPKPTYLADDRGAASVAHLYGQNLAAAESFTTCAPAPWAFAPSDLKPAADLEFALGINRLFIHTSVHQPLEKPPGLTLRSCGQYFNRLETWAEEAGPWVTYLARSSYLLQQGRFAADVAYFYGEEAPLTQLQMLGRLNDVPTANGFDFVNADALLHLFDVRDGSLVTPSGMQYRILQLGGTSGRMTVPVLRKLKELVQNGAIVVGLAPGDSPSLADDPNEFQRLITDLWGNEGRGHALGRGHVYGDVPVENVLAQEAGGPDFSYSRPHPDTEVMFLHRTLSNGELYFVSNRQNRAEQIDATFRVSGRIPELWHAETGTAEPVSFRIENGRTRIPLALKAFDAVFVVFRNTAHVTSETVPAAVSTALADIHGPWTVKFDPKRGAPASITLETLQSWTASADPGVKYFSGTATYTKIIDVPKHWLTATGQVILDLGEVRELAEMTVNGTELGVLWNKPYAADVTSVLRPGKNRLEVRITNLWVNRLIGDKQPDAERYAFTVVPTYTADAPLRPSGLIGPVRIMRVETAAR